MKPTDPITTQRISLRGYQYDELVSIIRSYGEQPYRARQIGDLLFNTKNSSFDQCSTAPRSLLKQLKEQYRFVSLTKREERISHDGQTIKYLFQTHDGHTIESVLIKNKARATVCLSTQIGCRFGCVFCMSGTRGLVRDLDASEIVDQVYCVSHYAECVITNIVVMGMGEPFDNYDEMMQAVRIIHSKEGFTIGARHITISTAGVPEGIERLAGEKMDQLKLAISLHAPNQALREKLMPISKKYSLEVLIACIEKHRTGFKRRMTLEYILFGGINDSIEHARELSVLANKIKAKVNLIPYNSTSQEGIDGHAFIRSSGAAIKQFEDVLRQHKVIATVRKSGGSDIAAACGQLSCE